MDITDIFINNGKIYEKMKGYRNKVAFISATNTLRVLKMVPIECYENAQVPYSPITLSYVINFSECYVNFRKIVIITEN